MTTNENETCQHLDRRIALGAFGVLEVMCNDCDEVLPEATCQHEDVTRHYSRFGATTWQCEDCGETTTETDVDEDEDGRGVRETPLWA